MSRSFSSLRQLYSPIRQLFYLTRWLREGGGGLRGAKGNCPLRVAPNLLWPPEITRTPVFSAELPARVKNLIQRIKWRRKLNCRYSVDSGAYNARPPPTSSSVAPFRWESSLWRAPFLDFAAASTRPAALPLRRSSLGSPSRRCQMSWSEHPLLRRIAKIFAS